MRNSKSHSMQDYFQEPWKIAHSAYGKSVGSMHFRKLSSAQFEILVEKQKEKEFMKSTK